MPSELEAHEILFSPLKKRRAEQSTRRAADQPEPSENAAVQSRVRHDSDAPPTDRAVAYAIEDADAGPLVSSKAIGVIAVAAAIATAAVLMRTPKLEAGAQDEATADERTWWSAAREQWANDSMRVWPIVLRKGRSMTTTAAADKAPPNATPNAATPASPVTASTTGQAVAQAPKAAAAATPSSAKVSAGSDNPYSNSPRVTPSASAKASDNPYADSPVPRAPKPTAAGPDNPY